MQRVEMEEMRQRDANMAALKALQNPRKRPKLDLQAPEEVNNKSFTPIHHFFILSFFFFQIILWLIFDFISFWIIRMQYLLKSFRKGSRVASPVGDMKASYITISW